MNYYQQMPQKENRMNSTTYEILQTLLKYKQLFVFLLIIDVGAILFIIILQLASHVKMLYKKIKEEEKEENIQALDYETLNKERKSYVLRKAIKADGLDPNQLSSFGISDAGKEVCKRSFTIAALPKTTKFAQTFEELLNYPDCTSSIFIEPVKEMQMIKKLDRQINILESEWINASKDRNRRRKLDGQVVEVEEWAQQVDCGENSFYEVGFLFTIEAEDITNLNKITDDFYAKALNKGIYITNCYGCQAEAYLSNAPTNQQYKSIDDSSFAAGNGVIMHLMDKYSLSTIYNYLYSDFSHKKGIPLGRNMYSNKPVFFDIYDPSHLAYNIIVAGKTGTGKSLCVKIMCMRYKLLGYRFVAIDGQVRKGTAEGEYAALAERMNGINFQISNRANNVLNLFQVSESTVLVRDTATSGYEVRTLELADKVNMLVSNFMTIIQDSKEIGDFKDLTFIIRILKDTVIKAYQQKGIVDGDADSLYVDGVEVIDGQLTPGKVRKPLPTVTEWYKIVLTDEKNNEDPIFAAAYKVILASLQDSVKELYYSKDSKLFFTADEFQKLPKKQDNSSIRIYTNAQGMEELVYEIRGTRAYYDGQSTVAISDDCYFTNIDISQLSEQEKKIARQIAIEFVNESYIKKNSESLNSAKKLVAIFDEAHECFTEQGRKVIEGVIRTARKRHTAILLCTQSLSEFHRYDETKTILEQTNIKLVFKQEDRKFILENLPITPSQADQIVALGGDPDDETKARYGECAIIDNNKVCFCQIDYIPSVEGLEAETKADELEKLISIKK